MKVKNIAVILGGVLAALIANASPITYTAFTIADGKLGEWEFHNARVYLTFESDTNNVQLLQISGADIVLNSTGTARITVAGDGRKVRATFMPNQIFVSLDQGGTGDTHVLGRGVGFGSKWSYGIEPAYPLGIEDGTIDGGDPVAFGNGTISFGDLPIDLVQATQFSGRAWTCIGFPDRTCPKPVNALKTDRGDLLLYQRYQALDNGDVLNGGLFWAVPSTRK
jgi:hypothetical protein